MLCWAVCAAAVGEGAWAPAEAQQVSGGGGNPRFGSVFEEPALLGGTAPVARSCGIVSDRPELRAAVVAALDARGITCTDILAREGASFASAERAVGSAAESAGGIDAIVVALASAAPSGDGSAPWERVLTEHAGIVEGIHADAGWARAASEHARATGGSVRLVTLTDAVTTGGRSRAQASAQLTRSARAATEGRVTGFAVSVESAGPRDLEAVGALTAYLVGRAGASGFAGAELVAGRGWVGVRSHPRPRGSVIMGTEEIGAWLDAPLREIVGAAP